MSSVTVIGVELGKLVKLKDIIDWLRERTGLYLHTSTSPIHTTTNRRQDCMK